MKNNFNFKKKPYHLDATDIPAGRLAAKTATILIGKQQVNWQPRLDLGDYVIIENIEKIKFTGKKYQQKKYYRTSGYLGGLKVEKLSILFKKNPAAVFKKIVFNMLPNNKLRNRRIKRLIIK